MLHQLRPAPGSRRPRKRVARGNSAGGGTTAGRGTKGQRARAGGLWRKGFEGGQTPMIRRQPKLGGFRNPRRVSYEVLNIGILEEKLEAGSYDITALKAAKLVKTRHPVKILGDGSVTKKFTLTVHGVSKSAKKAIEAAGGSVTIESGIKN